MIEEKQKPGSESAVETRPESASLLMTPVQIDIGSGYTVAIRYDEDEKQVVDVRTYGEIDHAKLRNEIRRVFPNAKIGRLGHMSKTRSRKKRRKKRLKRR